MFFTLKLCCHHFDVKILVIANLATKLKIISTREKALHANSNINAGKKQRVHLGKIVLTKSWEITK